VKHPVRYTSELLAWAALAALFGIWIVPFAAIGGTEFNSISPLSIVVAIIIGVIIGTVFWIYALKYLKKDMLFGVFALVMGLLTSRVLALLIPVFNNMLLRIISFLVFFTIFINVMMLMKRSWAGVRRWYWVYNIYFAVCVPAIAVMLGLLVSVVWAFVLVGIVALYDMYSVWKSKHMIDLAKKFMGARLFPGIGIPYESEKKGFAILGGGDIFFISFMTGAFAHNGLTNALMVTICAYCALLLLFLVSKKGRFYPAMPFIFMGCVIGGIISLVI
jgi:presenilin-like A22 family membrane protease